MVVQHCTTPEEYPHHSATPQQRTYACSYDYDHDLLASLTTNRLCHWCVTPPRQILKDHRARLTRHDAVVSARAAALHSARTPFLICVEGTGIHHLSNTSAWVSLGPGRDGNVEACMSKWNAAFKEPGCRESKGVRACTHLPGDHDNPGYRV